MVELCGNSGGAFLRRGSHDNHRGADTNDHHHDHHHDHNLRAAYLHVLADALTSVLAIAALTAGKYLGWTWMDPLLVLVGSIVIPNWSIGLLRQTTAVSLSFDVDPDRPLAPP